MKNYIVYSNRTDGTGTARIQIETTDKREAQKMLDYLNSLPGLCAWIEE